PRLHLLAGRVPGPAGPPGGGARRLRPRDRHRQRRRPVRRGVLAARGRHARQLPPGAHPPLAHRGGGRARAGRGRPGGGMSITVAQDTSIERLDVSAYTIPTDRLEADGTLAWDST